VIAAGALAVPAGGSSPEGPGAASAFPAQDPDLVRDVVIAGHGDLEKVKALVGRQQTLAKATYDWGFGDWETALGGAAHVGRPDIAEYLIGSGATPTIFSAAMLGQLDVVKAYAQASPGIQRLEGPHGITLYRHAVAGGARAKAVAEYLEALGGADERPPELPLAEGELAALSGEYEVVGRAATVTLSVVRGRLTFTHGGRSRGLVHLGSLELYPAGAENVRVRLRESSQGWTLTVHDPDVVLTARKAR
jgi:hypothetical protein